MTVIGHGCDNSALTPQQIEEIVAGAAKQIGAAGKRVLILVSDQTRSCPLPFITRLLYKHVGKTASRFDLMLALGTHPPLSSEQVDMLLGVPARQRAAVFPDMRVFNHRWDDDVFLARLGTLRSAEIGQLTGGKFAMDVDVTVNKLLLEYDVLLVAGAVLPHEIVGFSGGTDYLCPGVSGPALLNFFHWLGAVITSPRIIGTKHTPVRAAIDAAAELITKDKYAMCMVVCGSCEEHPTHSHAMLATPPLAGLYFGPVREAWSSAADLSARRHIHLVDRPFESVLSQAPTMYEELWVGAKCMYKLEPVVADGGELIIYAPHIRRISASHERIIEQVGYHTRDYFLAQWDRFKELPWGVLAHCAQLKGVGTYDSGVERPRIKVTLATGIPEETCRRINLGYRDPASIDISQWQNRPNRLYVPQAGEILYKLKDPPALEE